MPSPYGFTGLGTVSQSNFNAIKDDIYAWRFRWKWSQIETGENVFSFTTVRSQLDIVVAGGKKAIIQFLVSPNTPADQNTPQYIFDKGVPKVYTTNLVTYYPYYLNTYYTARFYNMGAQVIAWYNSLPTAHKDSVVLLFSAEGKTGDSDPYVGTPQDPAYIISAEDWNTYKYNFWNYVTGLTSLGFVINPGNDGENFPSTLTRPNYKAGNETHNHDLPGNRDYSNRLNTLRNPSTAGQYQNIVIGELEGTTTLTGTTAAPAQFYYAIATECLHANVAYINLSYANWISNRAPFQFYNKYAGVRNIADTDIGFSKSHFQIDVANTTLYSESEFGNVIEPSKQSAYDAKVANISASSKPDGQKSNLITAQKVASLNPARITALRAKYPQASYRTIQMGNDQDMRLQDFTVDGLTFNHEQYVYEINQFFNSTPYWRIGGTTAMEGQSCLSTDLKRYWYTPLVANFSYKVSISVTFYDDGGACALYYFNGIGKVSGLVINKTGTNTWVTRAVQINDFYGGRNLESGADFTLEHLSGTPTKTDRVEFKRIEANEILPTNIPPVAACTNPSQTITLPINSVQFDFTTSSDADGTITGYNFQFISGPGQYTLHFGNTALPVLNDLVEGVYVFRETVTDNEGGTDSIDVTVTVTNDDVSTAPTAIIATALLTVPVNTNVILDGSQSFDNAGSIAGYSWAVTGGAFTVDSTTASVINFVPTAIGVYTIELTVTNNSALTDTETIQITVVEADSYASLLGGFPRLIWLQFLTTADYASYLPGGNLKTSAVPTPLTQHGEGWQDIQIGFGTNEKYFSLNRNYSVPHKFINDGATILRALMYKGRGYEQEVYFRLAKWNRNTGIHEEEYSGKIDLSKAVDNIAEGVSVNMIEGGILAYLTANDGKSYEIASDESNPAAVLVAIQGPTLEDKFNYSIIEIDASFLSGYAAYTIPLVFLSNEGDNVGIISGSPTLDLVTDDIDPTPDTQTDNYAADSENFIFSSINPITVLVEGSIRFNNTNNYQLRVVLMIQTSLLQRVILYDSGVDGVNVDAEVTVSVSETVSLAANENFFIIAWVQREFASQPSVHYYESALSLSFQTRNPLSKNYGISYFDLMKQLALAMTDGKFTLESNFLTGNNNIVCHAGDALRQTSRDVVPKYLMATNFYDGYKAGNAWYNMGLKIINNVLYIEPKEDIYSGTNTLFVLGEVSKLELRYTDDRIINSIKVGYADQDYSQRNGKYEFNALREWNVPVTSKQQVYDITCPYRADCFGQSFIMDALENKNTTDNTGDKGVFVTVVNKDSADNAFYRANRTTAQVYASGDKVNFNVFTGTDFTQTGTDLTFTGSAQTTSINVYHNIDNDGSPVSVELRKNGTVIGLQFMSSPNGNDSSFTVPNIAIAPGNVLSVTVTNAGSTLTSTINRAQIQIDLTASVYQLSRPAYDVISGVLDNTVYNTEITPKRNLNAHMDYLNGLLYQQQGEEITFATGVKNTAFHTEFNGVIVDEDDTVVIGTGKAPWFIPYIARFTAPSPYTFSQTLIQMNAGLISFKWNGFELFGLPIGEMTSKPATDEPQEWEILLSAKNSLLSLFALSEATIFTSDNNTKMIGTSLLSPIHWIKYNFTLDARYHHKDLHDDWAYARHENWAAQPFYAQKWQHNDLIAMQFVTAGVGQLQVYVYDEKGKFVVNYAMNIINNSAVLTPYILQQINIDPSIFNAGKYLLVVVSGTTKIYISEWQDIQASHPNTALWEYRNTFNKLDFYFSNITPSLRVETIFGEWVPDSTFTDYTDEPGDKEMLHGVPTMHAPVYFGAGAGIPEWMSDKLNRMLLLNRVTGDGVRYTRTSDSKMEANVRQGYPFNSYAIEVQKAINDAMLIVSDTGEEIVNGLIGYTLDARMFGKADGVIQITSEDEP